MNVRTDNTCGKTRYADKRSAQTARNHLLRNRGRHGRAEQLRIYPCPTCRGWHLTKQKRRHEEEHA